MRTPNISRNLQSLGCTPTRVIQDNQCVNDLLKFGTNLVQVDVHLFGVRLVTNMADDSAGVWAKGIERVQFPYRRSCTIGGRLFFFVYMQLNTERCPNLDSSRKKYLHPLWSKTIWKDFRCRLAKGIAELLLCLEISVDMMRSQCSANHV